MTIKPPLVSTALAIRLKEVGSPQKSSFFYLVPINKGIGWLLAWNNGCGMLATFQSGQASYIAKDIIEKGFSAYTAEEAGSLLPNEINKYKLAIVKVDNDWCVGYAIKGEWWHKESSKLLVEAMAIMLLWLVENGHNSFRK